jgi:dihydrofolate synthase / folylpolyglutamate synthase
LQDSLNYLRNLEQFGIKFGLDNISAIVARLGHPEQAYRTVHIAGTNGKGSVAAMVDAALRAAGHRSARYTSPHLIDLAERFTIGGRPVDQMELVAATAVVRDAIEDLRRNGTLDVQPTFFEATTAIAFELFRRATVDVAVLEVGLGGRLDATNVVTPVVTAITSIAFDHQQYLGTTLGEIAREKAGIIKPGVPVIVGPLSAEADAVITGVAARRGAEMIRETPDVVSELPVALAGSHQRTNAAVAVGVLRTLDAKGIRVPAAAIAHGLAHPDWPGRLDLRRLRDGREALLDAAHNPAGAAALASYLRDWHAGEMKAPLVFAAMRDKDVTGMFEALLPTVGSVIVTRAETPRSAAPDELAAIVRQVAPETRVVVAATAADALTEAWRVSRRIVVAGSIFLLGDVMKLIEGA